MIVAMLDGTRVSNVVVVEALEQAAVLWPSVTVVPITPPAGIGWSYDALTQTFTPPVLPDPEPEPEPAP